MKGNQHACVTYRAGEKKVLFFLVSLAGFVLELIEFKNMEDARKLARNLPEGLISAKDFIDQELIPFLGVEFLSGR